MICSQEQGQAYSLYIDMPESLGASRDERMQRSSDLLDRLEQLDAPLLRFACWPEKNRAALSITGDIDSVTIQDFFRRILEVRG